MPDQVIRSVLCGALSCLALFFSGCGPDLGSPTQVSGTVTVDGEPLSGAQVMFHNLGEVPAQYRTYKATADSSGHYSIPEIYPGTYQVMATKPAQESAAADPGMLPAGPGSSSATGEKSLVPVDGDVLKVEVGSEGREVDIKLQQK